MRRLLAFVWAVGLACAACTLPGPAPAPAAPEVTPALAVLPERCLGDGAVQSWLLLPRDPPQSDLMRAYADRQVIEFQATVLGTDDDVSRLPHRSFVLGELGEEITVTLYYQGDPPPLLVGQTYRMVAWALPAPVPEATSSSLAPAAETAVEQVNREFYHSYELQVFDEKGLLFLGLTDVDLQDDPLAIELEDTAGECPTVTILNNACVEHRQIQPLRVRWQDAEVVLYPGEDRMLSLDGRRYQVSLYRNRSLALAEEACPGYWEHRRSLRLERVEPPPMVPIVPTIAVTQSQTTTVPLTTTVPITPP